MVGGIVVVVGTVQLPDRLTRPVRVPAAPFDQRADTASETEVSDPPVKVVYKYGLLFACGPAVNGAVIDHLRLFVAHEVMVQSIW